MATAQATPAQINSAVLSALQTSPNIALKSALLGTFSPGAGNSQIQITPQRTGLLRGFWLRATATLTAGASALTSNGILGFNLLQNIQYQDTSGQTRHNVSGAELTRAVAHRRQHIFGASTSGDFFGNAAANNADFNNSVSSFPNALAAAGVANVEMWYYVPIADMFSGQLNGIEAMAITNNTAQLGVTFNTGTLSADPNQNMFLGGACTVTNAQVEVWQQYYGGALPTDSNGNLLVPPLSVATKYRIASSPVQIALAQGARGMIALDKPLTYLSQTLVFAANGAVGPYSTSSGTPDLQKLGLYSDPETAVFDLPPSLYGVQTMLPGGQVPRGFYMLDYVQRPVPAQQAGLFYLGVTPNAAGPYAARVVEETLGS